MGARHADCFFTFGLIIALQYLACTNIGSATLADVVVVSTFAPKSDGRDRIFIGD